jgi:hypothetical protein
MKPYLLVALTGLILCATAGADGNDAGRFSGLKHDSLDLRRSGLDAKLKRIPVILKHSLHA